MIRPSPALIEKLHRCVPAAPQLLPLLEQYWQLLCKWNNAYNLVAPSTLEEGWQRHILDGVQLFPLIPPTAKVLTDFGSGAGIPAVLMAIAAKVSGRRMDVHAVESNGKKARFLRQVARECMLDLRIHEARIEALNPWPSDVITARALAPLPQLLDWVSPFCRNNYLCLFPKGCTSESEVQEARKAFAFDVKMHPSLSDDNATIVVVTALERL